MKDGPSAITEIKILVIKPSLLLHSEFVWLNHKEHFYYQCLVNYIILPSGIYSCSEGPPPPPVKINADLFLFLIVPWHDYSSHIYLAV